jgi:hypothetical protein
MWRQAPSTCRILFLSWKRSLQLKHNSSWNVAGLLLFREKFETERKGLRKICVVFFDCPNAAAS